jgi:aspartate ammonia-lyase
MALQPLLKALDELSAAFMVLGEKNAHVIKSGRTHLQDAVPVTIGQEFTAYGSAIANAATELRKREENLYLVALGGTATGTGANSHHDYKRLAVAELARLTGFPLKPAGDNFEALQSHRRAQTVSSGLKELALELIRIANDLRLLASGPTTGINEITLPPVQPGSSIMPGKVNPVMAECLDMVCYQVVGSDATVNLAVQAGQLELNAFEPVIFYKLFESLTMLTQGVRTLTEHCIKGITANEKRCRQHVENSAGIVTALCPYIGYTRAASLAKEALSSGMSVEALALRDGVLSKQELREILNPYAMTMTPGMQHEPLTMVP